MPRSTTFVSPVTTGTSAARAASRMDAVSCQSSSMEKPSSRMKAAEMARGRAPHMATSLTVPWTAREPMSPPGKILGRTTKESVDRARRPPGSQPAGSRIAPSPRASRAGFANALTNIPSIRTWDRRPPPPWAICTVG